MADLGADFGGGLHEAEVDYLQREEWALTTDDILWRRSKLGLHVPPGTAERLSAWLAGGPASVTSDEVGQPDDRRQSGAAPHTPPTRRLALHSSARPRPP